MKQLLMSMTLTLISFYLYSQDVIIGNDGTSEVAKVLEVGESEIRYKKFSNLEGPSYTMPLKDIARINYENGSSDEFETESTAPEIVQTEPEAKENVLSGIEINMDAFNISLANHMRLQFNLSPLKDLVVSKDGEKAVVVCMNPGFSDLNIWLCDLSSNTMTTLGFSFKCDMSSDRILVDFSADDEQVYMISSCYNIIFWDANTGEKLKTMNLNNKDIGALAISRGGLKYDKASDRIVASDNAIFIHTGDDNGFIMELSSDLNVEESLRNKNGMRLAQGEKIFDQLKIGPNNDLLAASPSFSKHVYVWDATTGNVIMSPKGEKAVYNMEVSVNSKNVITAAIKDAAIYDLENLNNVVAFLPFSSSTDGIATIGDYIILSGTDKKPYRSSFKVFDYQGQLLKTFDIEESKIAPDMIKFNETGNKIIGIDASHIHLTVWDVSY